MEEAARLEVERAILEVQDDEEEMGGAEGYFGGEAHVGRQGRPPRQSSFKAGGGAGATSSPAAAFWRRPPAAAQPWSARQQWKKSYRIVQWRTPWRLRRPLQVLRPPPHHHPQLWQRRRKAARGRRLSVPFRDRSERTRKRWLRCCARRRSFKSSGKDRTNKKNLLEMRRGEVGTVALSVWKRFAAFLGPCSRLHRTAFNGCGASGFLCGISGRKMGSG